MALTAETTQAAAGLLKQAYADEAITKVVPASSIIQEEVDPLSFATLLSKVIGYEITKIKTIISVEVRFPTCVVPCASRGA